MRDVTGTARVEGDGVAGTARPRGLKFGALLALLLTACSAPIGVEETGFEPIYRELRESVLDFGKPSDRSDQILAYLGLSELYEDDPAEAIATLEEAAIEVRSRPVFSHIAELHYHQALLTGHSSDFLQSAIAAYLYLFSEQLEPEVNPYSRDFRLACDLYNRGLARGLLGREGEVTIADQSHDLPRGRVTIEATRPGFPWDEEHFSHFLPADTFRVRGLRERIRTDGLGVPLIAVRTPGTGEVSLTKGSAGPKLPATAFLRVQGDLDEYEAGQIQAILELYLALDDPRVELAGERIPLESDFTAALAHNLEESRIWKFRKAGFFEGFTRDFRTGVFPLQPYQKGKIPLVMIHGTASSAATFAQLINGLNASVELRSRYQIWVSLYNTGNPILYSAAEQREALRALVAECDPRGEDPALRRMVVVGHSQGGLVARVLVSESGDRFWESVSDEDFDTYELAPENRELLERCLFFEPLPFVERVVFIATPHRGSFYATGWIGRLASRMVHLPEEITNAARDMLRDEPLPGELRRKVRTSVANMYPDSEFISVLSALGLPSGIRIHSIIAVEGAGPAEEGNDGTVAYESAHLDEAVSELVVRHGHSCQNEPETILEMRRILLEHLQSGDDL